MATGRIPTTANSPLTAKGDLFTFSTGSAKLAVGSNGDTLVADSSATTGLRWEGNYAAGKNAVINGDFRVWQRGTSFTNPVTAAYVADRWRISNAIAEPTSRTVTQETFTAGAAPVAGYEGAFFLRSTLTTVGSTAVVRIQQRIEDVRTFAGQTVSLSFWAKSDSNRTQSVTVIQNFGSGGSASVTALSASSFSTTTSWTRFTFTFTAPSLTGKTIGTSSFLELTINQALADGSVLDIWGIQLEAGSVATSFQTATGTLQGELAACQRYFYQFANGNDLFVGLGVNLNSTTAFTPVYFPVSMRIAPTLSASSGTNFYVFERSVAQDFFNSFTINRATPTAAFLVNSTEISGTAGAGGLMTTNNASSSIAFSSEL